MRALKTLGYVTFKTFTSPAYYADVLKAPFFFSFKFYLIFWLIWATVTATVIVPQALPMVSYATQVIPARLLELYPPDLVITLNNGQVSTNLVEPLYFPFKAIENLFQDIPRQVLGASSQRIDYFLVIDTQAQIEDFPSYRTYSLLTKEHFVYLNDQHNLEVVSLAQVDDLVLDRGKIEAFLEEVQPYLSLIPLIVLLFLLLAIYLGTAWSQLVYLLFFSCLTWLIAQLASLKLSYSKSYQLGLHLLVPVSTVLGLASLLDLDPGFPLFRTLVMALLMTVILLRLREGTSSPVSPTVLRSNPTA